MVFVSFFFLHCLDWAEFLWSSGITKVAGWSFYCIAWLPQRQADGLHWGIFSWYVGVWRCRVPSEFLIYEAIGVWFSLCLCYYSGFFWSRMDGWMARYPMEAERWRTLY